MKPYFVAMAIGLLVGAIYSLLGTRSPAPPAIALLGLLGMLLGEQAVPLAKWMLLAIFGWLIWVPLLYLLLRE